MMTIAVMVNQRSKSMNDYIKREDAIKNIKPMVGIWADDGRFYVDYQRVLDIINN